MTNRSAPPGPVIPVLTYPDVRAAVDWLVAVLDFEERVWIGPNHRAQLMFGAGSLIVADATKDRRAPSPEVTTVSIMLRVVDAAAVLERAVAHGAEVVHPIEDHVYGERQATFVDPAGHRWTLTQTLADVAPESWGGATGR